MIESIAPEIQVHCDKCGKMETVEAVEIVGQWDEGWAYDKNDIKDQLEDWTITEDEEHFCPDCKPCECEDCEDCCSNTESSK